MSLIHGIDAVGSITGPVTVASVTAPVTVASVTAPVTVASITNPVSIANVDSATGGVLTIDYPHHEIHSGSHFFVDGYQDLAINAVLDFTFLTPNTTKWIHWLWKLDCESETNWLIYEAAVATNALANAVTPFNNNRNSLVTSAATLKYELQANLAAANADTSVTTATLLESGIAGSGKSTGGFDSRVHDLV